MQMHYYSQMQIQMYVTEREWCDFYQWAPNGDNVERINFDKEYTHNALKALRHFYEEYLREREFPYAEKYLDGQAKSVQTPQA